MFFYISGHGFGHAAREMAVINALGTSSPDLRIVVRTSAPRRLFDLQVRVPMTLLEGETDTGIVQIDSLRMDENGTMTRAAEFYRTLPVRASREAEILREHDARLVIADAPPLGCAAAAIAGVPSVVVSNFTWDWIYEEYEADRTSDTFVLATIREAYAQASEGWRLPMCGGFRTVPNVIDIPFVARHARTGLTPREIRRQLSLPLDTPLALVSFGGYGVAGLRLDQLDCLDEVGVVVTTEKSGLAPTGGPILQVAEEDIYNCGLRYVDLTAAVDVVVTKPGYGIIADCVASNTAMLYTSRGRFAEYDVMVAEIPRFLRCEYLDLDSILAGRWRDALRRLLNQPRPPVRPRTDGADVVARLIADRLASASGR